MSIIQVVAIIVLIVLIASKFRKPKGVKQVTLAELHKQLNDESKQYIDVRTPSEFKASHLEGFQNIPLNKLRKQIHKLSPDKEIVVVCQSGIRSLEACRRLKRRGFRHITNVKDGLSSRHFKKDP